MKYLLSLFCILFYQAAGSQNQFSIKGNTPDLLNDKKIFLVVWDTYSDNRFKEKDSTVIRNSQFEFYGKISKPSEEAYIMIKEKGNFFYFVLDSGKTVLNIKTLPPRWPLYKNKLSNTSVENSYSNAIYDSLRNLINVYYLNFAKPDKNTNGIIQLDSIRSKELWLMELGIIERHLKQYYSLIYLYQLLLQRKAEAARIENVYNQLPANIRTSDLGQELSGKLSAILSTQIGHTIFKFSSKTVSGSIFSNNSLSGKPYLIAFGATWCKPCKENYPTLKNLYKKYSAKGFEIVDINIDDNRNLWEKQIKLYDLKWISISELKKWGDSDIAKHFGINYVPIYFVVDKNGVIIYNSSQLKDPEFKILDKILSDNVD